MTLFPISFQAKLYTFLKSVLSIHFQPKQDPFVFKKCLFERFSVKNPSNSLKVLSIFQQCCPKVKVFEGLRKLFSKSSLIIYSHIIFYLSSICAKQTSKTFFPAKRRYFAFNNFVINRNPSARSFFAKGLNALPLSIRQTTGVFL